MVCRTVNNVILTGLLVMCLLRRSTTNDAVNGLEKMEVSEAQSRSFTPNASHLRMKDNNTVLRTLFLPKNDTNPQKYDQIRRKNSRQDNFCDNPIQIRKIERLNQTKSFENGKVYAINKIVKSKKCRKSRMPKSQFIQRRTFNIIPTLQSIIPIPWMTKKTTEDDDLPQDYDDNGKLSRKQGEENGKLDSKGSKQFAGNKIKKLLSLFTIVKFDNADCFFNDVQGICLHTVQCQAKGGKSIGSCAKGYGICCYVEKTCGEMTSDNSTYFVNEGFPKPFVSAPKVCTLTVAKADPDVKQLRVDFVQFELRGPNNGTCISDRFSVTGHNTNDVVPDICGINSQQHVYIDVDEANGPFIFNVITMETDFPRNFRMKITQIRKDDPLLAPKNCLQYYTEEEGIVQTFNYQYTESGNLAQAISGYFNNLNYAICIKKRKGFCSISYENEERVSPNGNPSFQLTNLDEAGDRLLPPNQGGAEIFDCPDDYIIINGMRLCGEKLNDASNEIDYRKNSPVTDISNGPFTLQFRTNNAISGRGFYLKYRQNPCLV